MNIANVVSDLLQFNECVTIPEFGAFVVNPASAQIDMSKNKFTPPGKKLSFNKNITNNDGLLASAIAENEGISYEDAVHYIKAFVAQLKEDLKSKEIFELHSVGTFYYSHDKLLRFEPENQEGFGGFGLEVFHLAPLSANSGEGKEAVVMHPAIVPTATQYVNKTGTWGKVGWGLAVIPLLAYLVWVPTQSGVLNQNRNFQLSNLNPFKSTPCEEYVARQVGLSEIDLADNKLLYSDFDESTYQFSVAETTNVVMETPKEVAVKMRYQIIGGCFSDKANAARLVSRLQNQGYEAKIFDKKGRLYRVTYGGFASQKEARKALKEVKRNANASAWLYRMKK
tara:strand:- start:77594 stop:78610 length:1017 start_codon:yes stop_codon:yes gene_type:complete